MHISRVQCSIVECSLLQYMCITVQCSVMQHSEEESRAVQCCSVQFIISFLGAVLQSSTGGLPAAAPLSHNSGTHLDKGLKDLTLVSRVNLGF